MRALLLAAGLSLALLGCAASEPAPPPTQEPAPAPPAATPAEPAPSTQLEPDALTRADGLAAEARVSYKDFVRAVRAEAEPVEVRRLARAARADLHQALDAYNEALDPLRDDDGLLPPEHEAHEAAIQATTRYLVDLDKMAPLDDD